MPGSVSVLFNQAVRNATLHVLGPHGNRVDLDGTIVSGQGGRSVAVTTQDGGTGGYLVAWSAVPAGSGAAVSGALAFAVGRVPAWSTSGVAQYLSAGGAGPGLAATVNAVEGVELAGLLVLVGLVVALAGRWLRPGRGPYT
ncbi:MAG: copper resistance protein CopC, partial [Streptosporangiaceae bacterium]